MTVALAVALTAVAWGAAWQTEHPTVTVTFLDVGQGDAILIQGPARTVLVDGGGLRDVAPEQYDIGRAVVLPALMLAGVRSLDALVLSHADDDHAAGAVAVVEQLPVGLLLEPDLPSPALGYERLRAAAARRRVTRVAARTAQVMHLGAGARLYVLHPPSRRVLGTGSDLNNNSVVLKLVFGEVAFLFLGDLEDEGEAVLVHAGHNLRSTVLKVSHHGGATSTTAAVLEAVAPTLAVISVGANPFGHPSEPVLDRLRARGVMVLRTDVSGAVTVRTDGRRLWVTTFR